MQTPSVYKKSGTYETSACDRTRPHEKAGAPSTRTISARDARGGDIILDTVLKRRIFLSLLVAAMVVILLVARFAHISA